MEGSDNVQQHIVGMTGIGISAMTVQPADVKCREHSFRQVFAHFICVDCHIAHIAITNIHCFAFSCLL